MSFRSFAKLIYLEIPLVLLDDGHVFLHHSCTFMETLLAPQLEDLVLRTDLQLHWTSLDLFRDHYWTKMLEDMRSEPEVFAPMWKSLTCRVTHLKGGSRVADEPMMQTVRHGPPYSGLAYTERPGALGDKWVRISTNLGKRGISCYYLWENTSLVFS